jgi:hypothetical protein
MIGPCREKREDGGRAKYSILEYGGSVRGEFGRKKLLQ